MINNLQLLHHTGFLYRLLGSASQPAKNILKVLHLNVRHSSYDAVRHSSYDAVKFHHTFSMGKPLKHGPLMFMLTHVCGEARRHTLALNMHDFTIAPPSTASTM